MMSEQDDRAQAEVGIERRVEVLDVIHSAAMYGLPESDCRILCRECGVEWEDVTAHRPD